MFCRRGWWCSVLLLALVGCAADRAPEARPPASASPTAIPVISATPGIEATTPEPAPPIALDLLASRLTIPALGIDSPVQLSQVIPDNSPPTPGCPASPGGGETLTVPDQGIATPQDSLGLANKTWIFGHSRWQNQPGLFFALQDISLGDEVFVDGVDRSSGGRVTDRRFVVDGLYVTDIESGTRLVEDSVADPPTGALVLLQTSAREDGAGKQWLLNQQKVVAKSRNLVGGDINDPCKYLLLFVVARSS